MGADLSSGITDEMIEKAAAAAFLVMRSGVYADWTFADLEVHTQDVWRQAARDTLAAALAGCTVVHLPEPDLSTGGGNARWDDEDEAFAVEAAAGEVFDGDRWSGPDDAERQAARLLAAAREARRLASESGVGGGV